MPYDWQRQEQPEAKTLSRGLGLAYYERIIPWPRLDTTVRHLELRLTGVTGIDGARGLFMRRLMP